MPFVKFCIVYNILFQPPKQGSAGKKKLSKAEKEKLKAEEEERKAQEEGKYLKRPKRKKMLLQLVL